MILARDIWSCRWAREFLKGITNKEIIGSYGERDYDGYAMVVTHNDIYGFKIIQWSWGSCSCCDPFEDQVVNWDEVRKGHTMTFASEEEMMEYLESNWFGQVILGIEEE